MESSASSPEILRDISVPENLEEQCQEFLGTDEKPKKRNDTPWPEKTESKITSTGSLFNLNNDVGDDHEFLTPQSLNFSLLSSMNDSLLSSFVENDAPPNTPNTSTLEEKLVEEAQKQEVKLKEQLENLAKESEENIQEKSKIMSRIFIHTLSLLYQKSYNVCRVKFKFCEKYVL